MTAARLLAIVGLVSALAGVAPAAHQAAPTQTSGGAGVSAPPSIPWLDQLRTWVAAVVEHEPGKADEPTRTIGAWSEPDLQEVLDAIIALRPILKSEDQRLAQLRARSPGTPYKPPPVSYRKQQVPLKALQDVFGLASDEARRGDVNRLLRRGALLHAEIAVLSQSGAIGFANTVGGQTVLWSMDGRAVGYSGSVIHWEFGRLLLDALAPDPAQDETARLWYHATAAHMLSTGDLAAADAHFDHAPRLFETDADLLFERGYLHEVYASSRVQSVVRAQQAQNPRLTPPFGGQSAELRKAEDLFRRAVRANPGLIEARVRLAHVLNARAKYAEAAAELRNALGGAEEPQLRYYAEMLLGDAERALGRRDAARGCYERAAALYPTAQSPHLAISLLARRSGDRAGALRSIEKVLSVPRNDFWRSDPWWTYGVWQSRSADDLLLALRSRIRSEGTP